MWLITILQLILWSLVGAFIYLYATTIQEQPLLTILTPVKGSVPHPVFAQFIATQRLRFDKPAYVTKLIIPMGVPAYAEQIKISLYRDDHLVTWWKYPSAHQLFTSDGTKYVVLPFITPTELSGDMKLVLDGSHILYSNEAFAPGFYVEEQDTNYPNGNYSIANNQKSGDIGMQFITERTNYQLFVDQVHREPIGTLSMLLIFGSAAVLLSYMPILGIKLVQALVSKIRK